MTPPNRKSTRKHWYTISVETLRGWATLLVLLVLALVAYRAYEGLRTAYLERKAGEVIEEARQLLVRVQSDDRLIAFHKEYQVAREGLGRARSRLAAGAYPEALEEATRSRTLLVSVLEAGHHRGPAGEAQFIALQGSVEYRRGERGGWEVARSRVVLRSGDYVKTAHDGSAEIMFSDGTLYRVRPNTLFLVTRTRTTTGAPSEETISLEYGWVNLNTAQHRSSVATPGARARVDRESDAVVTYDQQSSVSRFAAYRGTVEVAARDGSRRQLAAMQQLTQGSEGLLETRPLPPRPVPLAPEDNRVLELGKADRLVLRWGDVSGAVRYALQVSRNRHFVGNVIDVEDRTGTHATLGLRGEGTFLWRVAAYGAEGLKGPWSSPRKFRVESGGNG